jgi:flagellar biosynthetic protein FlhB
MGLFDDIDDDSKTEEATPRRRQEARDKGQVALSSELISGLVLLGWLGAFALGGAEWIASMGRLLRAFITAVADFATTDLTLEAAAALIVGSAEQLAWPTLTLIVPLFGLTLFVGYVQIGWALSPKALELDPMKLSPLRGWSKLFSLRGLVRSGASLLKLLALCAAVGWTAWLQLDAIVATGSMEFRPALAALGYVVLRCAAAALGAVLVLGVLDLFFQRRQYEQDLRMTKQEVKEEARMSEGDPQVKARIRRVQREMATRRMMQDVPKATVVITNPTHYAVALTYDRHAAPEKRGAPRVVAKGVDLVAQRIKEVAREAGVVVYENAPLARTLHARCEIGDDVPVELYQAVAEVLAYVYGIREERAAVTA